MEIQNKNSQPRISLQYDFLAPPKIFVWFHSPSVICGNKLQYVASVDSGYQHQMGAKVLLTT